MTARAHRPHPRGHDRRDAALRARWVHLWISVVMLAVCSAVAAWAGPLWAKVGWGIAALLHFLVFVALFRELAPVRLWASRSLRGSPWVRLVSWGAGPGRGCHQRVAGRARPGRLRLGHRRLLPHRHLVLARHAMTISAAPSRSRRLSASSLVLAAAIASAGLPVVAAPSAPRRPVPTGPTAADLDRLEAARAKRARRAARRLLAGGAQ